MSYSNIEAENLPVSLFLLGYTNRWRKISLFGGVRNINHDYFTTPYASLFTNSSSGVFPTLSLNYPLANYPLSAMCLHFEYEPAKNLHIKTSLYNGVAHDPRKNVFASFTVDPKEDGIFSMSELTYTQNKFGSGVYALGAAIRATSEHGKSTYSLWGTAEQALFNNKKREIRFLLGGGFAPKARNVCNYYYAVGGYFSGLLTSGKKDKLGIFFDETLFLDTKERTMELTWQYPLIEQITFQPAFHYIRIGNRNSFVGLFRVLFSVE